MPRFAWIILVLTLGCPRPVPPPVERIRPTPPAPPPPIRVPPGCESALSGDWQHENDPSFRYHFEDDGVDATVWVYRVFPPTPVDAGRPGRAPPQLDAGTQVRDAGVIKPTRSPDGGVIKAERALRGPDGGVIKAPRIRDAGFVDAGFFDAGSFDAGFFDAGSPDAGALDAGDEPGVRDGGVNAGDAGPIDTSHRHPLPADLLPRDGGVAPLAAAVIHLQRTPNGFIGETEVIHLLASGRECRATFATRITACTPSTLTLSSATSTPVGEGCQTPSLPQPAAMLEHRLARTDAGAL
jgi:hypothetical protein